MKGSRINSTVLDKEKDYYTWCVVTARRLRALGDPLMNSLAEELEESARLEKHDLRNQLRRLHDHLLKWRYQPQARTSKWKSSIVDARNQITWLVEDSPGL